MPTMIQSCGTVDHPGWLELRQTMWPQDSPEAHRRDMAALLAQPERYGQFVAYGQDGAPAGFAEAAVRHDYVNGTESSPVAFLEGIYVHPAARRQGVARALALAVEQWAAARGCRELASDALLDNDESHAMHRALGFQETERVVYFRKMLPPLALPRPATPARVTIREGTPQDADALAAIYNHYVFNTIVTFEETPIEPSEMARRIQVVQDASLPWLVAEGGGELVGYAYAGPWKPRVGYRFTVEISIYLDREATGRGIGTALYTRLFEILAARGIRCIIGGIALPNDVSIVLHEKFGMRKVAHFERNGIKFGRWIDVGYWQKLTMEE
jgi:L-amino acid N-acyltransferase YncA